MDGAAVDLLLLNSMLLALLQIIMLACLYV